MWSCAQITVKKMLYHSFFLLLQLHAESNPANAFGSGDNDANKGKAFGPCRKVFYFVEFIMLKKIGSCFLS